METTPLERHIIGLAEPVLTALGLTLWGVEAQLSDKGQTVRLYVESADAPAAEPENGQPPSDAHLALLLKRGAVDIDRIAEASRHLSLLLDVDDVVPGAYRLEVSSPGFERPFFSAAQMAPFAGYRVEVRTLEPHDGRSKFRGTLAKVDGEELTVDTGDGELELAFSGVKKAKLLVDDPWSLSKSMAKELAKTHDKANPQKKRK